MHPAAQRVANAAADLDLPIEIVSFDQSTRTAQEAADAIGCNVDQIVKSLVFAVNGEPIIALVSGKNQLDTGKLAGQLGVGRKKVKRADADLVREATGYAIGGVPPFGHARPLSVYVDDHLLAFNEVWAAAGTPNTVFAIQPGELVRATRGVVTNLAQE